MFKTIALLTLSCLALPLALHAEDAITSRSEGIRILVATSRRFMADTKVASQGPVALHTTLQAQKDEIVRVHDAAIAGGKVPAFDDLRSLRRRIDRFYEIGVQSGIYKVGTPEDTAFSLNTSMAVSYLDCALHLAGDVEAGK